MDDSISINKVQDVRVDNNGYVTTYYSQPLSNLIDNEVISILDKYRCGDGLIATEDWVKKEFCNNIDMAYKTVFDSLKSAYLDKANEFEVTLKLCHMNYRHTVLCIEKELMKEEAERALELAE